MKDVLFITGFEKLTATMNVNSELINNLSKILKIFILSTQVT